MFDTETRSYRLRRAWDVRRRRSPTRPTGAGRWYAAPPAGMDIISIPTDEWRLAGRLALAALLGGILGLNREISLKPAGLRTHALVALGAALLTYVGLQIGQAAGDLAAASRVVQGLVAGIGFVGGGVILHRAEAQTVQGLTTAAS